MSNHTNTQILEDAQISFDSYLSQNDFEQARLVIEDLEENGFQHEVTILKGSLAKAIAEYLPMDERDLSDRAYSHD